MALDRIALRELRAVCVDDAHDLLDTAANVLAAGQVVRLREVALELLDVGLAAEDPEWVEATTQFIDLPDSTLAHEASAWIRRMSRLVELTLYR